jgi:conjugal transfer ATP-binding protein TraC
MTTYFAPKRGLARGESKLKSGSARLERNLLWHLPFWHLERGVVELRNRVLEVGFELQLPDSDFMGDEGLANLADTYLYIIRNCTPMGERFRLVTEIVPAVDSPLELYAEDITCENPQIRDLALSRLRVQQQVFDEGKVRQWRVYGTCTLSTFKKGGLEPLTESEWRVALEHAENLRERFAVAFNETGSVKIMAMDDDAVFSSIWRYLNMGLMPSRAPKYRPPAERELQALSNEARTKFPTLVVETLRHQLCQSEIDNENSSFIKVGGKYVSTLAMRSLPTTTIFGRINSVFSPTGSMYLITDIKHPNQPKAKRSLMNQAMFALGVAQGMGRAEAERKQAAVFEMEEAERHIVDVACVAVVIADSKDELKTMRRDVQNQFESISGLVLAGDTYEHFPHYIKALPFSGRSGVFARTTFDITAKNFLPTVSPWRGSRRATNVCMNRYGGLVPFDLWDERCANHHQIILGSTRSGKSFGAQAMMMGNLKAGDELVVIDRGNSWDQLVLSAGGGITEITPGVDSINPFELEPNQFVPEPDQAQVMANIMETMLPNPTGDQLSLIPHAIAQSFELAHWDEGGTTKKNLLLLNHIVTRFEKMNRIGNRAMGEKEREAALSLSRDLQAWIGDTPLGQFIDRPSSVDLRSKVLSFETKHIAEAGALQRVGMMILANLLMRWLMRSKGRKRIVYEEIKAMTDTPQAIKTLGTLFATAAKYNTAVTAINQGASIFLQPEMQGILDNSSVFMLFRLDSAEAQIIGDRLRLPQAVINELPRLRGLKGIYSECMAILKSADGTLEGGVMRIQTSPEEYWHYTSNGDDKLIRERVFNQFGGDRRGALLHLASEWRTW